MASGKTLQSTVEISGVLSPSLQAAIKGAVDRLADMADEALDSADAASRLVAEMSSQEDVLKTLQKAYAGYVASGEEGSSQAQELADKIRVVSGELEENRGTLQAAEKAASRLTETQGDANDAYAKLEKTINSQQTELAALRRQYANVALEQGESSKEAQDLSRRINDLSGELNQNKQKLKEAEQAANSFGQELEEAGEKAADSGEGYTVMKDVIADLATDTIKNAIDAFKELAIEGDKALGMLEARTGAGLTGKMEDYKDVLHEVYNDNYGESLGDVSEKLSTVIQMTDDLDNASLAKVTKNAIALEDVFGFDTAESLRAVNSLMDQFRITSDEAFNLIVQGAQNGLNQNDDLLDTINEYSVQFRSAGYSANDMFNMLTNGTESGTWSVDKLGDAVKEFNIRASDGTITDAIKENAKALGLSSKQAKQLGADIEGGSVAAYQQLLDKLYDVEDYSKRYQMGVSMFGTMWEDLGEDTVWALMNVEGAIDSTSNAMEQMDTAAYDNLGTKLEGIARRYKVVGSAVLGTVSAITLVAMNWDTLVSKFGMAKTALTKAGSAIATAIGGISAPVWAVIAVVAILVLAFTNLWKNNEAFRAKIIGIWEGIKEKFAEFGQAITDRLNALGFDFENFGEAIKAIWDGFCNILAPVFEGAFQLIADTLSVALDVIIGIFDIFVGLFTGNWDMMWQGIKEVFGSVWDFLVNTFKNMLNTLRGIADTVLGWFGTSWEEVWGGIKTFFVDTWNSVATFFAGVWEKIKAVFAPVGEFFASAWEKIKNVVQVGIMAIGAIISAAFQIITLPFRFIWENCKDIIMAAWNAIKVKVTTALNAIKTIITNVWNGIKGVITPVVNAIVNFIKQRWENLKNNVLTVFNAVKTIITNVWNGIKGVLTPIINAIVNVIKQRWENLKNNVSTAFNAVKTIATNVWNGIKTSIGNVVSGIMSTVSNIFDNIKSKVSGVFNSIKSIATTVWNGIKTAITTPINAARDAVKAAIDRIKGFFNFTWSLPHLKLPHFSIEGKFSLDPPSVPKLAVSWYKDGGILTQPTIFGTAGNTLLAGGEAGAEAVVPLSVLWDKLETMIRSVFNSASSTGEPSDAGLTSKAGELMSMDNFSLGSLSDNNSMVVYYDFSGFTWSPQIQTNGNSDEDDFMARLKAHEAEFFDWLEEFIQMREETQYA